MARSRNIKPGFFKNEDLGEMPLGARLLFAGLWTLADREGRLEDRPARIAGELFPYDREIGSTEVDTWLNSLASCSEAFIVRYESGRQRYLQISNFAKHQSPHIKEQASTMPAPGMHQTSTGHAPGIPEASTGHAPDQSDVSTGHAPDIQASIVGVPPAKSLIPSEHQTSTGHAPGWHLPRQCVAPPDSLIPSSLIPDSLIPEGTKAGRSRLKWAGGFTDDQFNEILEAFDRHLKHDNREPRELVVRTVMGMADFDWQKFRGNHLAYCEHQNRNGWGFSKLTFLGWINAGCPPPPPEPTGARRVAPDDSWVKDLQQEADAA